MCLGVPGKVIQIEESALGTTMGTVDFGGISKKICLAYVPDVKPGEYVVVHVGFAISRISEKDAAETLELLRQMGGLQDLEISEPGA